MTTPAHIDRPLLGIALMAGFCVLAPLGDSLAKILGPTIPLLQLLLVRFAAQGLLMAPMALKDRPALGPRLLWLIALRTALHIAGIGMMFSALVHMPLADAVSIAFVMPFILLLLGWLWLGEEVGLRRLLACAIGFGGTLLVLQPAFEEAGWIALLPLGVAVTFALFMLVTRSLSRHVASMTMHAISGGMATAVLLPAVVILGAWTVPSARDAALLAALGLLGTYAHLLMIWSLKYAPSTTLAPMQYIEIPVATLFGFVIFGDLPGPQASLGIAVICAAGLYVIWRERVTARSIMRASAAPP
ncbi:EamA domain-containing membrane protein RarD [Roseivivax lentus]|uniref:EamA domain-containing membrane protein RarD n=1 Tax=Roseivivax lentus TaxID=633194 RepID=A0A1N7NGU1_9RHOB|nr:DMT family transporter [Roseivivax lentus]SIS97399.1 EamA domain-containing membrane protein RarD [Roseivivax lentus]